MNHQEAVRLQAAEKYVLGELPPGLREQYEEHYFDCAECAEDVRATIAFVSAARELVREEPAPAPVVPDVRQARSRWRSWFRPAIAVPALAAVVLTVGYYALSTRPPMGEITAPGQALDSSPSFGLRGGDRLESERTVLHLHGNSAFQLHFDFVPVESRDISSYTGEVSDNSSRVLLRFDIPPDRVNKEVNLVVPAGRLRSGDYTLAVFGRAASSSAKMPVAKFAFAVENTP